HLVYHDESGMTRLLPLDGSRAVTIGRDATRDLVLANRQVSRYHASIETVCGSFLLRDAGSANGTFLNGLRLSGASAITLRDGDVIEIGGRRICFSTNVAAAEETLAPLGEGRAAFQETVLPFADLLRDGLARIREVPGASDPDESSTQVLRAFTGAPL